MTTISIQSSEETKVSQPYHQLIKNWNERDALHFAALFEKDVNQVGFDGSQINGRAEIESHLSQIFADHMTAVTSPSCGKSVF